MKCMLSLAVLAALCGLLAASNYNDGGYNSYAGGYSGGYSGGYGRQSSGHRGGYGGQGYGYGYQPGFNVRPGAVQAVYNNAYRQLGVNGIAKAYGTGIGTAPWYGVPGTGNYFDGHRGGYGGNNYH